MQDQKQNVIAAILKSNGTIAGTGFALRNGYVVTCAHVVLDALGLSKPAPETAPDTAFRIKFRFLEGQPEYEAIVATGGWFPKDSLDFDADGLRDIAILRPKDDGETFPAGLDPLNKSWRGEVVIIGFPAKRKGLRHKISGQVSDGPDTDGWLNCYPLKDLDHPNKGLIDAELGGLSGSPVFHEQVDGIAGILSGRWQDNELFFRIIPAQIIEQAVGGVLSCKTKHKEAGQLYVADSRQRSNQQTADGWRETGAKLPAPETVKELCEKLLEAARAKANHLPESFPFRYLERRLTGLTKLTGRGWPPEPHKTGQFIVDLADFISVLTSLPHEMNEPVAACHATGKAIGTMLAGAAPSQYSLSWNASDAPWPTGADTDMRRQAEALRNSVEPLVDHSDYGEAAEDIQDHADAIIDETYRNPPHWMRMRKSVAEVGEAADRLNDMGVSGAAGGLKHALAAISDAAIAGLAPFKRFQELPCAPEMVVMPQGSFLMGSPDDEEERFDSEGPQHEVNIRHPFAVGRYPVTVAEYAEFSRQTGRDGGDPESGELQHPVTRVSWEDAQAYVGWLNTLLGSKRYRLLSEAEWEYCCRAGTQTRYSFGDEFREDRANNNRSSTTKVGIYPANDFGLYDMHGNVYEWCEDRWHDSYRQKPDNLKANGGAWIGDGDSGRRFLRGGSWGNDPSGLQSAYRVRGTSDVRSSDIGFRVARTLNP